MGMRGLCVVLLSLLLAGCGGAGPTEDAEPGSEPEGCALGRDAIVTWSEILDGASAGTMTPTDLADAYGHLADRLGGVATLNPGTGLGNDAQDGADAAGRLRVGLVTGDGYLESDVPTVGAAVNHVAAVCG